MSRCLHCEFAIGAYYNCTWVSVGISSRYRILIFLCRPPDIKSSADLCFTGNSFLLLLDYLPSEPVERHSTKRGHMFGSECDLKMYLKHLLFLQSGAKTTFLDDFAT